MLYASIKTGVSVTLSDLGLNTLFDLLRYSSEIDAAVLAKVEGKKIRKTESMTVADMTARGKMRG